MCQIASEKEVARQPLPIEVTPEYNNFMQIASHQITVLHSHL